MSFLRITAVVLCLCLVGNLARAESSYRLEGKVTEFQTGKPLAGGIVRVLITSAPVSEPEKRILEATSGEDGRYSLAVPIGHAMAWSFSPPEGYYPIKRHDQQMFATTVERPVFTKDYQVVTGIPLPVRVQLADELEVPSKLFVTFAQQRENEYIAEFTELHGKTEGVVHFPEMEGKYKVMAGDMHGQIFAQGEPTIEFEKGFDPRLAVSMDEEADGGTIRSIFG
jgi:hypothetical protein